MTDERKKEKWPRTFHVYCDNMLDVIDGLTDEEAAAVLREIIYFGDTAERRDHFNNLPGAKAVFGMLASRAEDFREKYFDTCDNGTKAANTRWEKEKKKKSKLFEI